MFNDIDDWDSGDDRDKLLIQIRELKKERDTLQVRVGEMAAEVERLSNMSIDEFERRWQFGDSENDRLKAQKPVTDYKVQVCKLGTWGKAYDLPEDKRAYSYSAQPDNSGAYRLGRALRIASNMKKGDYIDEGLNLLLALGQEGFGIFELEVTNEIRT